MPTQVVRAALVNKEGQYFLHQRQPESSGADQWIPAGGKVEPGESAEQALKRELAEELGLTAVGMITFELGNDYGSDEYPTVAYLVFLDASNEHKVLNSDNPTEEQELGRWFSYSEIKVMHALTEFSKLPHIGPLAVAVWETIKQRLNLHRFEPRLAFGSGQIIFDAQEYLKAFEEGVGYGGKQNQTVR